MIKYLKRNNSNKYALTVVGGGLVGLSFVNKIARHDYFKDKKILLLEKHDLFKVDYSKYSPRLFNITLTSVKFLGFSSKVLNDQFLAKGYKSMQIWNQTDSSYININVDDYNEDTYSYMLNYNFVADQLLNQMKELDNIEYKFNKDLELVENQEEKGVKLKLIEEDDIEDIDTDLLIASDGGNSKIADISNVYRKGFSHRQKGLVTRLEVDSHNDQAYQKYFVGEVIGILPLHNNQCSIVWSVQNDYYDILVNMKEEEFLQELNKKVQSNDYIKQDNNRLFVKPPKFTKRLDKCLGFPLKTAWLEDFYKNNIVFIGDSAHNTHPMLGQGLNMGFYDAKILSEFIIKDLDVGKSLNQPSYLKQYEFYSRMNCHKLQLFVEFAKFAYYQDNSLVNWARSGIIKMLNLSPSLKYLIRSDYL